ncbi:MAG: hypothetical protein JNL28_04875 [Planctomycetes bacterium]|nr:hypothetical protein [Planctomycetota bacterium]
MIAAVSSAIAKVAILSSTVPSPQRFQTDTELTPQRFRTDTEPHRRDPTPLLTSWFAICAVAFVRV